MVTNMKHATTLKKRIDPAMMAAAIAAAPDVAVYDSDNPPTAPGDWDNAIISHSLPELREKLAARRRGKGKRPAKALVSLRIEQDVLARWRASGPGWQTRMSEVLAKTDCPAPLRQADGTR
jgi:uncharacterized protein (DUF4415 family)